MNRLGATLRTLLPLAILCAAAAAAPGSASAKVIVGMSDNNYAMFTQPRFQSLHITTVRDMVSWNVAVQRNKRELYQVNAWLGWAKAVHAAPLISFSGNGNYVPTVAQYTAAIKAFIKRFPSVKAYTAWDEPDWMYRSLYRKPTLAAAYFNALVKSCRRCTIVAGDVHLPAAQLGRWLRAYKRGLHYRPVAWALHPYIDVRTHSTAQLRAMEANTSGPIWLDEVSGSLARGHWSYPNQSAAAAGRDERFLFSLPKRFHRITRIYHYQWQANVKVPWDSALLAPSGAPRPAFSEFVNALHGKLP